MRDECQQSENRGSDPYCLPAVAKQRADDENSHADLTARYQKLQKQNKWLSELADKTVSMLQQESVDTLLRYIAEELVGVSCANAAYIHMLHETGDYLGIVAAVGSLDDYLMAGMQYKGHGVFAKAWETGLSQFVADYNNHPGCIQVLDTQIQAVSLPLVFAGEMLGVVFVTSELDAALGDDLDLLAQIAVIASLAIHHASQREAVARELFRTKTLSSISSLIHQYQQWDELAQHVCPKLFDALDLARVSLYQTDSVENQLRTYASWERVDDSVEKCDTVESSLVNETISAWCFWNRQAAQIDRTVEDPRESAATHAFRHRQDIGSTLCVPIIEDETVWGVMTVCRNIDKRNFDENDANTIHSVVRQMSTALQRQSLLLEVQHQARHDSLTNLPNRRRFEEYLNEILTDDSMRETKKAVLFFDLDGFKDVNDTHGHAAGDAVLKQVAQRLVNRKESGVLLARMGGDEFSVIIPEIDKLDDAVQCAKKMSEGLSDYFYVGQHKLEIGVSIGISYYPRDGVESKDLIRRADVAMYQAKRKGRNHIVSFDQNLARSIREEKKREQDLRKAVSEQEFDLWYQPQVSLDTGLVTGVEALIRWQHPTKGMLPPTTFIPLAEELGLISLVGTWVLERGCQQMVDWQHEDPVPWHLGINVSAPQVMKKEFAASVLKILSAYGIDGEKLQIEITESILLSDIEAVVRNFQLLRAHGVRIALDDFGTGFSSLKHLQELPVDILKIDRAFVCKLEEDDALESLASTIVLLANRFGLSTVAEGVETIQQLELVKQLKCDVVQGFYFSKPVKSDDLPGVITGINQAQHPSLKVA